MRIAFSVTARKQATIRGVGAALALLALTFLLAAGTGCRPSADAAEAGGHVAVEFDPAPPAVGVAKVAITLSNAAGEPVRLGALDVEANMNHAGMKPVFTRLEESAPGRYTGTLEFTMGGDWFLLLSGQGADDVRFERTIDVPGVRSR